MNIFNNYYGKTRLGNRFCSDKNVLNVNLVKKKNVSTKKIPRNDDILKIK